MIYWIFVILTILSSGVIFATSFVNSKNFRRELNSYEKFLYYNQDDIYFISGIICAISTIATIAMLIAIVIAQTGAAGNRASNEQTYQALIYKAETESIRDEFGIVNKEYIDEVQKWNEDISKYKANSENFWIGIFYPKNALGDVDVIDLNSIKTRD